MKKLTLILFVLMMSVSVNTFGQRYVADDDDKASVENNSRLSIMLSDVLVRRISLEYERVLADGKMSFNIPFSITISPFEDLWSDEVHWWAGMGVKFYPTGQGTVRYFLGPEFRVISVTENEYDWYYDSYGDYRETSTQEDYVNTAFLINNGLIYSPTDSFFVSLNLGVGFLSRNPDSYYEALIPFATPSFRLGFKF
jgi:hypothetical protein